MKFKLSKKIIAISLSAIAIVPLLANCAVTSPNTTLNNQEQQIQDTEQEKNESCTITYFGKNCTVDRKAIIARATDSSPKAFHLKLKHFNRDEKANKLIEGYFGFKYQMPSHTYAYTSCPMSSKTTDDKLWGNELWENNGINEMGVGITCTLTCATNDEVLRHDPFLTNGFGEELETAILTPLSSTAREAMEIAAHIIDTKGNQDANIIMACDQNETWLMEMYSGHEYCAVKLPDDKVCVAGNEFILDSLNDLGINAENKDQNCIVSPKLLSLPKEKGFAKYKDAATEAEQDIFHLDLFNTYARPLCTKEGGQEKTNTDRDHMRTWRGYSLFDRSNTDKYQYDKKYAPFFVPKDENGNIRNDLTAHDVMEVYRDEYDEILEPGNPRYDQRFVDAKVVDNLRTIAVEATRAVHIMSSDPNLPRELSAQEWFTPSSGNYTPFLQLNSGITNIEGEYGFFPDRFNFDENCSSVLFRELNKLAWYDRENYGYPIQKYWRIFENIYCKQMDQVVKDASQLSSIDKAKNIITNFNKHVRDVYIQAVKDVKNDLMWHIMDQPSEPEKAVFVPLVDLENFVKELGWTNYKFDGNIASFERNNDKCSYQISNGQVYAKGSLNVNGENFELKDSVRNNKVYVDLVTLNNAIAQKSEIRTINISDYESGFPVIYLAWIIPVSAIVGAGIGFGIYFLVKKQKNKKK